MTIFHFRTKNNFSFLGLMTAFHFFLSGYGWKSLTLLFHPVNPYVHTFLVVTGLSKLQGGFSRKVLTKSLFAILIFYWFLFFRTNRYSSKGENCSRLQINVYQYLTKYEHQKKNQVKKAKIIYSVH